MIGSDAFLPEPPLAMVLAGYAVLGCSGGHRRADGSRPGSNINFLVSPRVSPCAGGVTGFLYCQVIMETP